MSPAVVQHRHSGRAPPYTTSGRCNASAPYRKRSPAAFSTATPSPPPPTGISSSSSSSIPPLVPLSWTKLQQIISWRNDVSAAQTAASSSSSGHSIAAETMEMEQEVLDYWDDGNDGIDRYTFVPEGGGERRLFDLPHPEMNPLMTSEQALIEQEYVRVITQWNGYEEEKWKAEKIYRREPTPENLTQFMKTANAVKVAGDAARYVELHASRWRVPTNFDALFCRHYRPPSFFLYLADPDDWNPPPWFYDDGLQQPPLSSPCMESFYSQHPIPPPLFHSQQPPISLQVPKWTIPSLHPMQLAV